MRIPEENIDKYSALLTYITFTLSYIKKIFNESCWLTLPNTSEAPHLQVLGSSAQGGHVDLILDMLFMKQWKEHWNTLSSTLRDRKIDCY